MESNIFNHCMKNEHFALFINYMVLTKEVRNFYNELYSRMKKVKLNDDFTLYDFFEKGQNEGQCGYSCILLSLLFDDFVIASGRNEFVKGTINSPNGEHAWLVAGGKIYDTSLKLIYEKGHGLGYEETCRLTKNELLTCDQYRQLCRMMSQGVPLLKDESIAWVVLDFMLKKNIEKRDLKLK